MTVEQRLQWVALPNGASADGTQLRLSVFVAPRLRTDEGVTLAPFTDFLDWPAVLNAAGVSFAVELDDGTSIPATVEGEAPESTLWTAFFGPATVLAPFAFERFADRPLVSFSVGEVIGALRRIYALVAAASPDELPRMVPTARQEPREPGLVDWFGNLMEATADGPLGEGVRSGPELDARIEGLLEGARAESAERRARGGVPSLVPNEPMPASGAVANHFQRVVIFHRRPGDPVAMPGDDEPAVDHFEASVDFHQMLSALGDHPALLRRLGLVVDLTVPRAALPAADDLAPLLLRVRPTWTSTLAPGESADVLPLTACVHQEVDGEVFFGPADREPNPLAPFQAPPTGLAPLPPARFGVEQVDVDGAALKALNLAAGLNRVVRRDPGDTPLEEPERTGVPALRTGGLALVHTDRAAALQSDFSRAVTINDGVEAGGPVPLYAEDLVRGYRLDVWEGAAGAWRSLHERVATYDVVGLVPPLPEVLDEGFFQLAVAGKAVAPTQPPDPNSELYVHETVVSWDGWSLAASRPGKALSRDARAPADDDPATQPQRVTNDALTSLGLSIETRVRPGTLPRLRFGRAYRFRLRTVDVAGNGPAVAEADRRLAMAATDTPIVPVAGESRYLRFEPVAAPALVPRVAFGEGASLLRLVVRSNAGVTAEAYAAEHPPYAGFDDRHVVAPKAALDMVERHGLLDGVIGSDGTPPDEARRAAIAATYEVARREKGSVADVEPADQLTLPYLPDPLAAGAMFLGLPGLPAGEPFVVTFDGPSWYEVAPFRLALREGEAAPAWDADARVLTVSLPQATTATFRVCSLFGGDIRDMGIVSWCEETLAGDALEAVYRAASENRCWMLTPWHEVRLVHAVQQPLEPPDFAELEITRDTSATVAQVFGVVPVHPASTEKIDLMAQWTENVDDLADLRPAVRSSSQVVFSLPLKVAARYGNETAVRSVPFSLRDERFVTFFSRPREDRSTLPVTPHFFGDTKHRWVGYSVVATTPFREYFPPAWADDPKLLSRSSGVAGMSVPSSAPPAVPLVLYVVPTQGWETDDGDGQSVRRRRGGGLRVYLGRPWWSSGDGELLGVVVGYPLTSPAANDYPHVTLLGQDPVRSSEPLEFARVERFRAPAAVATRMRVMEMPGQNDWVTIVGYEPAYDEATQRWFCDIELDTEAAYLPFVRLALVRYQPDSLPGCHVSQVVRCDIVQTLPDRTLTVRRDPADAGVVDITVAGASYTGIAGPIGPRTDAAALGRMVATLEERDPSLADDVIGWRPVDGTEVELAPAPAGGAVTWTGRLSVGPAGDGRPRRVAVVEHDHLVGDDETADAAGVVPRVVYADVVEV